ncbi:MAG: ABC transporter permease subunit [Candidatus Thermoplasmatota archaeon]|nr:ABC transporter permease subunit [Candidatus Thermoplasmatota archaeon]
MHWRNAWIVMRKDLDEFKKQKLVIGSIVAMPIVLGVVLPLVMFVPMVTMVPLDRPWDVDGLLQIGSYPEDTSPPWTNHTIENTSLTAAVLHHTTLKNVQLTRCIIISCVLDNTTISDSTIQNSSLSSTFLTNVTVIRSEGRGLTGRYILAVSSNLRFTKTKPSEIDQVLPLMFNMVLMIFIIIPATLPTIIATYSIVGEKNNRSLEPLLATPTTDGELLAGKIFSSFLPSMGSTLLAFTLGVVLLDIVLIPKVGYPLLPNLSWILSMVLLAPTACLMSVLACVLVSSKVSDVRAAQQLGGFIVMPVVVLMLGVLSGFIFLSPWMIVIFAGLYGLIDLLLFYFVKAVFNREKILTKWT